MPQVMDLLKRFFSEEVQDSEQYFVVYYSGCGAVDSGDWAFSDGFIEITDILQLWQVNKMPSQPFWLDSHHLTHRWRFDCPQSSQDY